MSGTGASRRRNDPLRVFVVENNDDTRTLLGMLIEENGDVVQSAGTVAEALALLLGDSQSDVLVADLGLPDGTGWALLETLRAEQPDRPIYAIAMSGFGSPADRDRSHAAGFRHHLVKPVDPGRIETILDEARQERDAAA